MKKIVFAAFLCALCGRLNAQEAQLLGAELSVADSGKKTAGVAVADGPKTEGGFAVDKRHIVAQGDTLWDLSRKYYGDPFKWGRIYNANINSVSNPDRIYPKNELEIPDITEEVTPSSASGEVNPAAQKGPAAGDDETVKEPELESSEILTAQEISAPATPVAAETASLPQSADKLKEFFLGGGLSEEMPSDQKGWGSGVRIVADNWREDGVITAKAALENEVADSFSITGETVLVGLRSEGLVKKGDHLNAYMKGTPAYDKKGKRLGFELQRAGILEVLSVNGRQVKAKVLDASTPINKGLLVKKK